MQILVTHRVIGSTDTKRALHTTCVKDVNHDVDKDDNDSISVYVGAVSTVLMTIIITRTSGDVGTLGCFIIATIQLKE